MITKKIKTTSGPLAITIPSDIKDITLGMVIALTPEPGDTLSPLQQLSVLSGIPKEFDPGKPDVICLEDICDISDLDIFTEPMDKLSYQIKAAASEPGDLPESILIPVGVTHSKRWFNRSRTHVGKLVPVIKNLGIAPAGAYLEAKELIRAEYEEWARVKKEFDPGIEFKPSINSICRLLSLYFYVPATGEKFNSARAAEFDDVIKKLPITKALPIARYFFLAYPNLSKPKARP